MKQVGRLRAISGLIPLLLWSAKTTPPQDEAKFHRRAVLARIDSHSRPTNRSIHSRRMQHTGENGAALSTVWRGEFV
ncbi:hypothetical protein DMENIID0001_008790 [Sergentomyia squamirostris]